MRQSAEKFDNRTAINSLHQESKLTFRQVQKQAETFAAGLLALGLEPGDHVGIWAPNTVEWYISILGIIKAGLVAVNLNPLYECPELESAIKNTDVKALIIGDTLKNKNYYQMMEKIIPELSSWNSGIQINCQHLPFLKVLIVMSNTFFSGTYRWEDILSRPTTYHREKLKEIEKEINIHDVCNIQFTSGTTGSIKGACMTHYNILNNAYLTGKRGEFMEKHHVICLQVPFFHSFGTVLGILIHLHFGATLILPSMKFSPTKSIDAIIKERCTIVYGTPTMYIDLINVTRKLEEVDQSIRSKMRSLEIAVTAGALCTPELFRKMKYYLNLKHIYSGYGMTEVGPIAFFSTSNDTEYQVTSTIGCVLDHTEVKVINENGHLVQFGEAGECCFRGYGVMKGYYNNVEITNKAFLPNGWIRSGDRFILKEDGYGQVIGRIKDTIIRGGENIEPGEIEIQLTTHPDIIHVQVFAVADARLGETVAASIVKRENSSLSESDVRKFCEGKLAAYKIPKYIQFVDDFPRTATGKVMKFQLRKNLEKQLNLTS